MLSLTLIISIIVHQPVEWWRKNTEGNAYGSGHDSLLSRHFTEGRNWV